MPRAGFYNDNEYRAYPFVFGAGFNDVALPNAAIVDANVIMDLMSGFDAMLHNVWLASVSRDADVFTFTFQTNAPGAASQPLTIARAAAATEWQSEHVTADDWEGFFVTGPLTELAALLANGQTLSLTATDRVLEPARVQSLVKSYLRSINLANYERIMAAPSELCGGETNSERALIVNAVGMQGNLRVKEGYNCRITQIDFSRQLRVAPELNAGSTPDFALCGHGGELPLYAEEPLGQDGNTTPVDRGSADEMPPTETPRTGDAYLLIDTNEYVVWNGNKWVNVGETLPVEIVKASKFYGGGPACDEVLSTINGIGGPNVKLVGGSGVSVITEAETNTVRVTLDNNNLVGKCGT